MWYWLFIKEKTNQFIVLSDDELNMKGLGYCVMITMS